MENFYPEKYIGSGTDCDYGQFGVDGMHLGGLICSNLALVHRSVLENGAIPNKTYLV